MTDFYRIKRLPPYVFTIVNDLKTGPDAKGAVALWIDVGTVAHFRNLTITPGPVVRRSVH